MTGKYRGPPHSKCNINVTQDQISLILFVFHNFSNYDCHMFFKKLVDKKNDKAKFDIIPKTNEEYISVTYGCIRFINSYRFLSISLESLVKTIVDNDHKTLENLQKGIVENDEIINIVHKLKKLTSEDRTIKDIKKEFPDEFQKNRRNLKLFVSGNDPKILKSEFPDKWEYPNEQLANPYE